MVKAYIRVSTQEQDHAAQKQAILEFANDKGIRVDKFIAVTMSSRKQKEERRIDELEELDEGDTLISTELSRIGRSVPQVLEVLNGLIQKKVRVILLKQNLDIKNGEMDIASKVIVHMFSLMAELERDLISQRTKEALAHKKTKGVLPKGWRKGQGRTSICDHYKTDIKHMKQLGYSYPMISSSLRLRGANITPRGIAKWIKNNTIKNNVATL
jgi:putative DNA-invertase from lambdoid prophage Rac